MERFEADRQTPANACSSRFKGNTSVAVCMPLCSLLKTTEINGGVEYHELNVTSYGGLETECVNQFWWNLVHNSTLGTQWHSRDQILKILKFKMADGRHIPKCWKCYNSPVNGPIWTKLGRSNLMSETCPLWCGCHGDARCLVTAHWRYSS